MDATLDEDFARTEPAVTVQIQGGRQRFWISQLMAHQCIKLKVIALFRQLSSSRWHSEGFPTSCTLCLNQPCYH